MNESPAAAPPLKLAVITETVSHFEIPLYRLCAGDKRLAFKVFYVLPVTQELYDTEYKQTIDWGENMLAGYDSEQGETADDLWHKARAWGADVMMMYGYGWKGAPAVAFRNWRLRIPQIHRGTLNYFLDPRRPVRGRLMRPLRSLLLRLFHAHHYGGDYSRRVLRSAGVRPEAMFMVPYSVDTEYFRAVADAPATVADARALREALGWDPGDRVLLFIAQHNWFKGPDIAMEVFRSWRQNDPRARFLIVGSGRMTDAMRKYAEDHLPAGSYHFAGFIPSKQTGMYYLASDLVLCTSRYETWARMINEAMLCRRACVINYIVPAAGGLIDDGRTGFVVEPGVENYVRAVSTYFALGSPDRQAMQSAARRTAEEFSYEKHFENFIACAHYAAARPLRAGARSIAS